MENKVYQIKIESILGGHSTYGFGRADQFQTSLGIDPDSNAISSYKPSGMLFPKMGVKQSSFNNAPLWFITNPKTDLVLVYDSEGSVYSMASGASLTVSQLGDFDGDLGTSSGNGAAYYDNYVYFARDTTIARLGPMNGTALGVNDYWVGVLGKPALTNPIYPYAHTNILSLRIPNHIMHRHSDGKLYFADVVGNQGYLHYIQTTKTTVEGDTDNGSTYQALEFPWGFYPTAIESYGSDLVIALFEGTAGTFAPNTRQTRAKLSFWDTTSQNYNKITEVEFPDQVIFALKNANGVLYVFSGTTPRQGGSAVSGFRVSRFVGGYSFEQVAVIEEGFAPFPGAIDAILNKLIFGSASIDPIDTHGCVWAIGSKNSPISNAVFNIAGASGSSSAFVTALKFMYPGNPVGNFMTFGWSTGNVGTDYNGIDLVNTGSNGVSPTWRSRVYAIGQRFKIKKIAFTVSSINSASIVAKINVDGNYSTADYTSNTISSASYSDKRIVLRPNNLVGKNDFYLEFNWNGNAKNAGILLPITIEYELIDD